MDVSGNRNATIFLVKQSNKIAVKTATPANLTYFTNQAQNLSLTSYLYHNMTVLLRLPKVIYAGRVSLEVYTCNRVCNKDRMCRKKTQISVHRLENKMTLPYEELELWFIESRNLEGGDYTNDHNQHFLRNNR
jgi:hypothetical protein